MDRVVFPSVERVQAVHGRYAFPGRQDTEEMELGIDIEAEDAPRVQGLLHPCLRLWRRRDWRLPRRRRRHR
jgi:hypothetical protein